MKSVISATLASLWKHDSVPTVDDPITVREVEEIARRKLPSNVYNYYASGSDEQFAVRRNAEAFDRLCIRPRVMRDVSAVNTSTTLFGHEYPLPIGIAPSAMQKLVGGDGELDMARAATKLGLNMILSTQSTTSMEDVMKVRTGSDNPPQFWHQLYLTQDPERSLSIIQRAEGYEALVLTVDTPVLGNRINERKSPLSLPSPLGLANLHPELPSPEESRLEEKKKKKKNTKKPTLDRLLMDVRTAHDAATLTDSSAALALKSSSLTWESTMPFLRSATTTSLKIILKGIMTAEDARLAVEHGADAIIVSNHGGRQLDSTSSTIEALPEIVDAVAGRIPVILDGGVTRGSDVFKALALGADFVLVGRAVLWGLSHKGQQGVETVCNILERELSRTMALAGVTRIADIGRESLGVPRADGFGISKL